VTNLFEVDCLDPFLCLLAFFTNRPIATSKATIPATIPPYAAPDDIVADVAGELVSRDADVDPDSVPTGDEDGGLVVTMDEVGASVAGCAGL